MTTIFTTESGRQLSYYGVEFGAWQAEFMGRGMTLDELFALLIQQSRIVNMITIKHMPPHMDKVQFSR